MNKVFIVETYEEVAGIIDIAFNDYLNSFNGYFEKFNDENIQLAIKRCYFYNRRFVTASRKNGAVAFFRVQVFPKNLSFNQAKKNFLAKEFFSHKIAEFQRMKSSYRVEVYPANDRHLRVFLENILLKVSKANKRGRSSVIALKESLGDVFRSFVFMHRYRTEVKTTFRGFNLHWIILIIAVLLTILSVESYYRLIILNG
ncbi:MAG: hypothetical protein E7525_04535 [Ruminococcaceae bacterium]|nr:hypothetical protein [Oscillospiraceae bacterium]